jgi:mycothiol system anti-sigma-R factor
MNCQQVLQRLWQYLDGELDGEDSGEVARHLEECRRCFSRAQFERHLQAMVRRSCESEEIPRDLKGRVDKLLRLF